MTTYLSIYKLFAHMQACYFTKALSILAFYLHNYQGLEYQKFRKIYTNKSFLELHFTPREQISFESYNN